MQRTVEVSKIVPQELVIQQEQDRATGDESASSDSLLSLIHI